MMRVAWALAVVTSISAGCGDDGLSVPPGLAQPSAVPTPLSAATVGATSAPPQLQPGGPAAVNPQPGERAAAELDPPSRAWLFRAAGAPETLAVELSARVAGVGRRLRHDAAQPLALDFAGGTRVTLEPHSELWVLDLAPSVLLVSGRAQIERLPDAARPDQPPLRIATLAGALGVTSAAVLRLRVEPEREPTHPLPRARLQLGLLQGGVSWQHAGPDQQLALEQLIAGGPLPHLPALQLIAATTLAEAEKRAHRAFRTLPAWGPAADPDARLEALLTELAALRDQGQALLSPVQLRHLRAPAPDAGAKRAAAPTASPRTYQREIVQHAQRKLALKQLTLLATEQSLLSRLYSCVDPPAGPQPCPALLAWAERFAERVRAAL